MIPKWLLEIVDSGLGKMFWGGLVEYRLAMSLVQGTNVQGEMCTKGSKVMALGGSEIVATCNG